MMSVIFMLLLYCFSVFADGPKEMSLQEALAIVPNLKKFNATWLSDSEFYYETLESTLRAFNVETKSFRDVATSDILTKWEAAEYSLSPDNKKILVQTEQDRVNPNPNSIAAKCDIYDFDKKESFKVGGGKMLRAMTWSPSGDKFAFVSENDIYVRMPDGNEVRITNNGIDGVIYNGIPDLVYDEEVLCSSSALWFSPDGEKLAFGYFDDTDVKSYPHLIYGTPGSLKNQYPTLISRRYPLPGTTNPKVKVKIVDLKTPDNIAAELTAPTVVTDDHILGSVTWASENKVLVKWLNRVQNIASFQLCDFTGECKEVVKLEEPKTWVEANVQKCLPGGNNCILLSWIENFYQIWNLELTTGTNTFSSLGDISVAEFYGYQESTKDLYYQATVSEDQNQLHVYKNKECLSCSLKDAEGIPCKYAEAVFSKDLSYYALTCSGPSVGYTRIYDSKTNEAIYDWELNAEAREEHKQKLLPKSEMFAVPISGDLKATLKVLMPSDLNENEKYPLIVLVHNTPHHTIDVISEFECGYVGYLAASKKIIMAHIDGRGTGNKGKNTFYALKGRLGTDEVEDVFTILKFLQDKYSFIDSTRIGIWGLNYAGYIAGKVVSKDPTNIFKCALINSAMTSWIYYNSIFSERYLGMVSNAEDLKNYETADLTQNVTNFKGHKILLQHGTGDCMVRPQNSLMLARALAEADIQFDQMVYPDSDAQVVEYLAHYTHFMERFWNQCFDLK